MTVRKILKNCGIGFMDTVTRADDVDVFLPIHEYYPELDDKWLCRIPALIFPENPESGKEKRIFK
ncbi:MAG: hypothetical protein MZV70_30465 [Desulfobacterales bacterium]|nr:hypothetical protein [Desulfobacterales bacterium]